MTTEKKPARGTSLTVTPHTRATGEISLAPSRIEKSLHVYIGSRCHFRPERKRGTKMAFSRPKVCETPSQRKRKYSQTEKCAASRKHHRRCKYTGPEKNVEMTIVMSAINHPLNYDRPMHVVSTKTAFKCAQ